MRATRAGVRAATGEGSGKDGGMTNPILAWGPFVLFILAAAVGSVIGYLQFLSI